MGKAHVDMIAQEAKSEVPAYLKWRDEGRRSFILEEAASKLAATTQESSADAEAKHVPQKNRWRKAAILISVDNYLKRWVKGPKGSSSDASVAHPRPAEKAGASLQESSRVLFSLHDTNEAQEGK